VIEIMAGIVDRMTGCWGNGWNCSWHGWGNSWLQSSRCDWFLR